MNRLRIEDVTTGLRVQWLDPDGDSSSGPGTVTRVQHHEDDDAIISVALDDGGEVEAFCFELARLEAR